MPLIYADQKEALTIIVYNTPSSNVNDFFSFVYKNVGVGEFPLYSCLNSAKKGNPIAPARQILNQGKFEVVHSIFVLLFQNLRHSILTP